MINRTSFNTLPSSRHLKQGRIMVGFWIGSIVSISSLVERFRLIAEFRVSRELSQNSRKFWIVKWSDDHDWMKVLFTTHMLANWSWQICNSHWEMVSLACDFSGNKPFSSVREWLLFLLFGGRLCATWNNPVTKLLGFTRYLCKSDTIFELTRGFPVRRALRLLYSSLQTESISRDIFHSIAFCTQLILWIIRLSTIVDSIAEKYVDGKDFSITGRFRLRTERADISFTRRSSAFYADRGPFR
jgi:ABC-type uncharacterized transport system fused permease/ATPase subunit